MGLFDFDEVDDSLGRLSAEDAPVTNSASPLIT
jgi:hypothetical protein